MNAINENTIRRLVLDGESEKIRALVLCDSSIELIKLIKERGEITSACLSSLSDISIANASSKLNKLYLKGYLSRQYSTHESGGAEFIYSIADISFKEIYLHQPHRDHK